MQHQWVNNIGLSKRAIAGAIAGAVAALFAPVPIWAGAQATPDQAAPAAMDEAGTSGAAGASHNTVYSVINLGPEAGAAALLNERGQAAFGSINNYGITNGFFDGDRVHDIGSLGGGHTWVWGLNKHGVVVGESETGEVRSRILAYAWTLERGMRALPGTSSPSSARDINDRNYIVGWTRAPDISARAIRWNPDGTVTMLGPVPTSLSEAFAINENNLSTGFTDLASGDIHATLWDRAGAQSDLGTLGGDSAFGMHINERNDVAGESSTADGRLRGFFWSRASGMVPINVEQGGVRLVADLNDRGEVVGITDITGRSTAYHWSLGRGVVPLPYGSATRSDVFDINNRSEMTGTVQRSAAEGGGLRAVRWPSVTTMPIDLNTRLHRPPAGLVVEIGAAINEDGVILAHSNAGLVMLRPGKRGTDAPVLGPITGLPDVLEVGQDLALTVGFVDNARAETHRANAVWSDTCPSPAPTVGEWGGVGQVRLQHQFCAAGFHAVKVRVTDSGGRYTEVQRDILVDAPALAAIIGKGSLVSGGSVGRGYRDQPLKFALWAPLAGGASNKGSVDGPVVSFSGPFQFRSVQVTTAAATGAQARVEGTGRLNGREGYRFVLEAVDSGGHGAGPDRLSVRVTHVDAVTGAEVVDYDNGAPANASATRASATVDRTAVMEGGFTLRNAKR